VVDRYAQCLSVAAFCGFGCCHMLGDRNYLVLIAVDSLASFCLGPRYMLFKDCYSAEYLLEYGGLHCDLVFVSCDENASIAWKVVDSLCNVS